jgi:hypothetical protein
MYAVAAKGSAVWALFLSRKPFTPHGSTIGVRIRSEFITNAIAAGVRIGEFDSLHQSGEADIVSNLALLSVGLREPPAPYPRQTTK